MLSLNGIKKQILATQAYANQTDVPAPHAVKTMLDWTVKEGDDAQKAAVSEFVRDIVKTGNDFGNPSRVDSDTLAVIAKYAYRCLPEDQIPVVCGMLELIKSPSQLLSVARRVDSFADPATVAKVLIVSEKSDATTLHEIELRLHKCASDVALDLSKVILGSGKADTNTMKRAQRRLPATPDLANVFAPK